MRPKAPFLSWVQTEIQLARKFGARPCRLRQGEKPKCQSKRLTQEACLIIHAPAFHQAANCGIQYPAMLLPSSSLRISPSQHTLGRVQITGQQSHFHTFSFWHHSTGMLGLVHAHSSSGEKTAQEEQTAWLKYKVVSPWLCWLESVSGQKLLGKPASHFKVHRTIGCFSKISLFSSL